MAVAGAGIGTAFASSNEEDPNNPMSALILAVANKFNLDKNEVQAVFEEQREAMRVERQEQMTQRREAAQQEFATRLDEAVKDGKLTQEQADLIEQKHSEIKAEREANKPEEGGRQNITDEERQEMREKMQEQKEELRQWADQNNIPDEYLMMGGMERRHGQGMGIPGGACLQDSNE